MKFFRLKEFIQLGVSKEMTLAGINRTLCLICKCLYLTLYHLCIKKVVNTQETEIHKH